MMVLLGHISEVAKDGDYICLPWTSDNEIAVANEHDALFAFDNRCPHRGARIYTELRGNREPRCAYHARLATSANTNRMPLQRWGDWLVAAPPDAQPHSDLIDFLHGAPSLTPHSLLTFTMNCPWTVAIENALDFEHVAHAHGGSLAKLGLKKKALQMYSCGSSVEEFTADRSIRRLGEFFPNVLMFDYAHAHFFPYSCLSSTRGWTFSLQNYFPRADGKTTFIHRLYTSPTTRPLPHFFDSVARLNERVFREDAAICALVPAVAGQLGPHEARLAHFRKTCTP